MPTISTTLPKNWYTMATATQAVKKWSAGAMRMNRMGTADLGVTVFIKRLARTKPGVTARTTDRRGATSTAPA